jgi:peptidoglycan/xylan/chitin deacetylase (PgdA/CDA1 family)
VLQKTERVLEEKGISFMFTVDVEKDHAPQGETYTGVTTVPHLLDFLDDHTITATVFTTGDVARKFPDTIKDIAKIHEVGCHMDNHEPLAPTPYDNRNFPLKSLEKALDAANKAISSIITPSCFRAPYLAFSSSITPALLHHGYTISSSVPASHSRGLLVKGDITEICVSAGLSLEPLAYNVFSLENLLIFKNNLLRRVFDLLILHSSIPVIPVVFLCHSWEITAAALSAITEMLEFFPDTTVFECMSDFYKKIT